MPIFKKGFANRSESVCPDGVAPKILLLTSQLKCRVKINFTEARARKKKSFLVGR